MAFNYPKFADNTNIYMLLDGAKINDLARLIYTANNVIDGSALYGATPLAAVLDVSPWLISVKDLTAFLPLMEQMQVNGAGLIIESNKNLEELVKFWRSRLFVELPEGQRVIFRLYEPSVLSALLTMASLSEKQQLMGPNDVIWYWSENDSRWQHLVSEINNPSESVETVETLRLTEEHLITLTKLKKKQSTLKLYSHIQRYFPNTISCPKQGEKLVKMVQDKATLLGFNTGQALFYFANIWATLGESCLDANMHPEISALLTQNSQLSHATRIERAAFLASKIKV